MASRRRVSRSQNCLPCRRARHGRHEYGGGHACYRVIFIEACPCWPRSVGEDCGFVTARRLTHHWARKRGTHVQQEALTHFIVLCHEPLETNPDTFEMKNSPSDSLPEQDGKGATRYIGSVSAERRPLLKPMKTETRQKSAVGSLALGDIFIPIEVR